MFLAFLFISNLTESSLVDGNNIYWIVYTAVFINLVPKTGKIAVPARVSARRRMPRLVTVKVGIPQA
jgi:hypothetical protein